MLAIADSDTNIHLAKQATTTIIPVIIPNDMTARLPYGSTMESLYISTLYLPVIIKQSRQIHILPKMKTAPLISLGVFCDDECTITLDKQEMSVQEIGQQIIKGTKNKQN